MHGFFIYMMADNNTGVENFLSSSLAERFIKTIVLNLRDSAGGKLTIDVFIKHYFSKNRRILTSILGSFVDKHFLPWDSSSTMVTKNREAFRIIDLESTQGQLWNTLRKCIYIKEHSKLYFPIAEKMRLYSLYCNFSY